MKPNQDLFDITTSGLMRLRTVLEEVNPDLVFIQEDTTTAFIGALATFYHKM
ncbi:UDP-N-acetylglucosamine 2-epimerase [Candidatus Tisiphia endosymbiont of Sialis lutaria]